MPIPDNDKAVECLSLVSWLAGRAPADPETKDAVRRIQDCVELIRLDRYHLALMRDALQEANRSGSDTLGCIADALAEADRVLRT